MIKLKTYKQGDDLVVGACDKHLIGKKFRDGKLQIDVSRHFYDGDLVDKKTLERYLEDATIANLVGEETVGYAIKLGFVDPDCVLRVKGVPHAQMVRMF